jgi:hypothetical protein
VLTTLIENVELHTCDLTKGGELRTFLRLEDFEKKQIAALSSPSLGITKEIMS